jgi:hypothetical protein
MCRATDEGHHVNYPKFLLIKTKTVNHQSSVKVKKVKLSLYRINSALCPTCWGVELCLLFS